MRKATLFLTAMIFSVTVFAQFPKDKVVTYKGYSVTTIYQYDTVLVENPDNGELTYRITRGEKVALLNGESINYVEEATQPVGAAAQKDLLSFLKELASAYLKKIREEKMQLLIVIDKRGKLAYFAPRYASGQDIESGNIPAEYRNIEQKLEKLNFVPATKDGKAVHYGIYISSFQ